MMNTRWKFQLIVGVTWATLTMALMALFLHLSGQLTEELKSPGWILYVILMYTAGIFFFGWMLWRQKNKNKNIANK